MAAILSRPQCVNMVIEKIYGIIVCVTSQTLMLLPANVSLFFFHMFFSTDSLSFNYILIHR